MIALLAIAACGGGDDEADTTTAETTEGVTDETGAETTTTTEAVPIEEIVAMAAGASPEDVQCGEEGLEAAIGGGGTCEAEGVEYVVADFGEELELDTLTARLAGLDLAKKVSGDYLKPRAAKVGVFVVGSLSITNESKRPERFDDFGEQVQLKAGQETYREPFNVLNGVLTASFLWKGKKIQPGESQVGKVAFDVPEPALEAIESEGALLVLNFGDEGNPRRADQVGLIRTAE